jgi:hypothetical protein
MTNDDVRQKKSQLSEEGMKLAVNYFNHVEAQVGLAATTANVVIACDTLLIAGMSLAVFRVVEPWVTLFPGLLLCISLLFALTSVNPNIEGLNKEKNIERGDVVRNIFFFQTIGAMGGGTIKGGIPAYLAAYKALDNDQLYDALLEQIFGKSRWLTKMFFRVKVALGFTVAGALFLILRLALGIK